jgi:ABC-type nitrate/sulfonate/bicarbonate transport system substrate-binding protein
MYRLEYGVPTDKCALSVRLGIEKGFFRDEGIDLSVRVVFSGPAIADAYNSGALKLGEIGSPPAVAHISRGYGFCIVGGGLRRKAHMYLCVAKSIRSWEELKGKRLGLLSRGSCPEWFMRGMLKARGFNPEDHVQYVGLLQDYPRVVDIFREGKIDAFLCGEPAPSEAELEGLVDVWCAVLDEPSLPQYQWIVHVAKPSFIEKEPEAVRATLRACSRSGYYAAANVEEWIDFGTRQFDLNRPTVDRAIKRELPHLHLDGQVDMDGLGEIIKLQDTLGAISKPITAEGVCDLRFVPNVRQPIGS